MSSPFDFAARLADLDRASLLRRRRPVDSPCAPQIEPSAATTTWDWRPTRF